MFKQAVPGVMAFLLLLSVSAAAITGYRLYQVSNAATLLLTGACSNVEQAKIDAAIKEALAKRSAEPGN